jgi:hypothetical protein
MFWLRAAARLDPKLAKIASHHGGTSYQNSFFPCRLVLGRLKRCIHTLAMVFQLIYRSNMICHSLTDRESGRRA